MARWGNDKVAAVRANIFAPAWGAITGSPNEFPWHLHAESPKSSQALAIDVFGTIRTHERRETILGAIAAAVGLSSDGPWDVIPEWHDASNSLNEKVVTQVDAAAVGGSAIILFECKFTEEGGSCSQTKADGKKRVACSGAYALQTNPQNGIEARCALTGKGIRYWDHIPAVYGIDASADNAACPFRFDAYQWMRNVVLARSIAGLHGKRTRVVAAYADAPFLKTAAKVKAGNVGLAPLDAADAIVPLSYQHIIAIATEAAPDPVWDQLRNWVEVKIERQRGAA
jgi:hypothetical protein